MRKNLLFYFLIVCSLPSLIAQESSLRVDTCQLITPLDLAPHIVFTKDKAFKINDLAHQIFQPFTSESAVSLQPDSTYWFRFTLNNLSSTTVFKAYLFTGKQSVTELFEPDGRVLKSGENTIVSDLDLPNERMLLPILMPPSTENTYYLRLKTRKMSSVKVYVQLYTDLHRKEARRTWLFNSKKMVIFYSFFLITLLIVAIFSLIQGRLIRDKTYIYYAFYLLSIFMYYGRNYERTWDYPILCLRFPILYDLFEVYLNCITYLLYILFFRQFLDIPKRMPEINKILSGIFWTIIGTLGINILVQIVWGVKAGLWYFDRMRVFFFIFVLFYFYILFFLKSDKLSRLVGFGLLAAILPAVVSVFENITHSVLLDTPWGMIWRSYQFGNFNYGFYDMRVGILIEIACFSTALYYKTKAERQKNWETRQHLTALAEQHERLKQTHEQAEKDRLTLEEKEAALKRQLEVLKNNVSEEAGNSEENEFILRGLKIIELQMTNQRFSVDDFAQAMHMSRGKFYAEWKKATGQTPNESILNARLAEVQRLLLTTNLTIANIADQTGFNEASYLSQVFFKKFGQSPSDFREK